MRCPRCLIKINPESELWMQVDSNLDRYCEGCYDSWHEIEESLFNAWLNPRYQHYEGNVELKEFEGKLYREIPQDLLKRYYKKVKEAKKEEISSKYGSQIYASQIYDSLLKHIKEFIHEDID